MRERSPFPGEENARRELAADARLPPAGQQERAPEGGHRAGAEREGVGGGRRTRRDGGRIARRDDGGIGRRGRRILGRGPDRRRQKRTEPRASHAIDRSGARERWRERVGIEPTGATVGVSVAVLKTGQTTRPDPLPSDDGGRLATPSVEGVAAECVGGNIGPSGAVRARRSPRSRRGPRGAAPRPRRWSAPGGGRRRRWHRRCSSPRSRPCPPGRPSS